MKHATNYEELKPYIPENNFEENYALLTHYLMMSNGDEKSAKRSELINKYNFTDEKLKGAEEFFVSKNVRFKEQVSSFTFRKTECKKTSSSVIHLPEVFLIR